MTDKILCSRITDEMSSSLYNYKINHKIIKNVLSFLIFSKLFTEIWEVGEGHRIIICDWKLF